MDKLLEESLLYHSKPKPGKFEIYINKKEELVKKKAQQNLLGF